MFGHVNQCQEMMVEQVRILVWCYFSVVLYQEFIALCNWPEMTSSARCWTVAVRMEIFNSFGSYVNGLTEGKAVYNEVRMFLIFIQHGSHEFYSEVIFTILIPGKLVVKFDWSVQILTEMWFFSCFERQSTSLWMLPEILKFSEGFQCVCQRLATLNSISCELI